MVPIIKVKADAGIRLTALLVQRLSRVRRFRELSIQDCRRVTWGTDEATARMTLAHRADGEGATGFGFAGSGGSIGRAGDAAGRDVTVVEFNSSER
ncbi:hypothetical protein EVAR_37676_1 [Eumeta japonica]|uniref:Uncharacterized protein n=1 Tax=Eumeta variegata TaxID=151549 RepID=A0A4C1Z043_EUMVA|nr:hypothetical protein EVAR_37676_1 [Eumeta japonica]